MKATNTRVTPNIQVIFQMLNILFTIQSFEKKVQQNEEKIQGCKNGSFKLLPTYTQNIIKEYEGAIETWRLRIREEEGNYNLLLNQLVANALTSTEVKQELPELTDKIFDDSESIESYHHRNKCGAH